MENLNKSFEPMDVDLSVRSTSAMDISENNSISEVEKFDEDCYIVTPQSPVLKKLPTSSPVSEAKTNIKTYHINKKRQSNNSSMKNRLRIITVLFVVLISIIYQCRIQCFQELKLENLKKNLSSHVFGQAKAIESIIGAFEADKKYKVLFFYGGTGVGKTYTSSFIMDYIGLSSNLYHYTMPMFVDTFTSSLMFGLIMCDSSVIIIDDLSVDTNVSEQINKVIDKSKYLEKNVTIILIYNCASTENVYHKKCDESFQSKLLEVYKNEDASFFFIKFETLTDDSLRKCIDKELGEVKIDNLTYEKILKNFDVTSDGCKTVHNKVKFLNMI